MNIQVLCIVHKPEQVICISSFCMSTLSHFLSSNSTWYCRWYTSQGSWCICYHNNYTFSNTRIHNNWCRVSHSYVTHSPKRLSISQLFSFYICANFILCFFLLLSPPLLSPITSSSSFSLSSSSYHGITSSSTSSYHHLHSPPSPLLLLLLLPLLPSSSSSSSSFFLSSPSYHSTPDKYGLLWSN